MVKRRTPAKQSDNGLAGATIAFVGAGAMGEAMIGGLLANRLVTAGAITACDPRAPRRRELQARYGIRASADNRAAVRGADVVVLAVKPQILSAVCQELRGTVRAGAVVISIVAGARLASIERGLGHRAVIRSMPNTPAQVGEGMTVWTATAKVTARQRAQAQAMLRALGLELYAKEERFLDMATAVSGSGPAYVFLVMEALIDAAVHLGFSPADARTLVLQTVGGSAAYAKKSERHPAELRSQVTSPGGTTAHALRELEKGGVRSALAEAVLAAFRRSVELGEGKKAK